MPLTDPILRRIRVPWRQNDLGDDSEWRCPLLPKRDIATHSMAKRRHFGNFCFALLYLFPAFVYRSVKSGMLIGYSKKVHQYPIGLLDRDGTLLSHFNTATSSEVALVSSMSACDTAESLNSKTSVHFGAHPRLTRALHL